MMISIGWLIEYACLISWNFCWNNVVVYSTGKLWTLVSSSRHYLQSFSISMNLVIIQVPPFKILRTRPSSNDQNSIYDTQGTICELVSAQTPHQPSPFNLQQTTKIHLHTPKQTHNASHPYYNKQHIRVALTTQNGSRKILETFGKLHAIEIIHLVLKLT